MKNSNRFLAVSAIAINSLNAKGTELNISLTGSEPVTHRAIRFKCDEHGTAIGLPTGEFKVDYWNGGNNRLAVLPIQGHSLIFAGIMSGSGERYAAGQYIWWDAGSRGIHLYSNPDSASDKQQTACQKVQ